MNAWRAIAEQTRAREDARLLDAAMGALYDGILEAYQVPLWQPPAGLLALGWGGRYADATHYLERPAG